MRGVLILALVAIATSVLVAASDAELVLVCDALSSVGSTVTTVPSELEVGFTAGQTLAGIASDPQFVQESVGFWHWMKWKDATDVGPAPDQETVPSVYRVEQNFPNPFNPTTTIRVAIPTRAGQGPESLRVFDVKGRLVRTLMSGVATPGTHEVLWDGRDALGRRVSSGLYFYQFTAPGFEATKRLVVLK